MQSAFGLSWVILSGLIFDTIEVERVIPDKRVHTAQAHLGRHFSHMHTAQANLGRHFSHMHTVQAHLGRHFSHMHLDPLFQSWALKSYIVICIGCKNIGMYGLWYRAELLNHILSFVYGVKTLVCMAYGIELGS